MTSRHLLIARSAQAELDRRRRMMDQREKAEKDLMDFLRMFWRVVEPETPLIEGWPLEAMADLLMAASDGDINRAIVNVPPGFMKSLLLCVFWPAWEWGPLGRPHLRYLSASYNVTLPERDNDRFSRIIRDPVYQRCWGDKVQLTRNGMSLVENSATGWKRAISTGGGTTGHRGDRILIDDANNPNDVESDDVRGSTIRWLREIMPDRLNDQSKGVIINLQQRVHEEDATGTLAKYGKGYVWLNIPMEFDPLRICSVIYRHDEDGEPEGWTDPRALDDDGELLDGLETDARGQVYVRPGSAMARAEGTLAWPARFGEDAVQALKVQKGEWAWCNPGEAPVLMGDLTMRPIRDVRVGDMVVGFETGTLPRRPGERYARRRLRQAEVKSISVSHRPVVRITLDSGRVIRCTPDHKWYTGRGSSDQTHPLYAPAKIGRKLMRVCDPELPQLSPEDQRRAGWLGGFFDADGTFSVQNRRRRHEDQSTGLVSFAQGSGRNGPLCTKLEETLTHFGFEWSYAVKRVGNRHDVRMYWLRRGGLPVYQRFLHIAQPSKWRERFVAASMSANFIRSEERVVSIEPDGEETVFGLETTTGNYVVWGLASSNSGQYQQSPTIRGGGTIRREWWQPWHGRSYPEMGTTVLSIDTALEDGEENDWNAMTGWGAFAGDQGRPQFMLMGAWRYKLPLAQLVARVIEHAEAIGADYILIEHKTRGRDLADELVRIFSGSPWQVVLVPARGDKVSRLHAVSHFFSGDVRRAPPTRDPATGAEVAGVDVWTGGMIWAPDTDWADEVITEVAAFPRGAHDDYVDTVSQALGWMRRNGVVLRAPEHDMAEADRRTFRPKMTVPYAL